MHEGSLYPELLSLVLHTMLGASVSMGMGRRQQGEPERSVWRLRKAGGLEHMEGNTKNRRKMQQTHVQHVLQPGEVEARRDGRAGLIECQRGCTRVGRR